MTRTVYARNSHNEPTLGLAGVFSADLPSRSCVNGNWIRR